MTEEINWGPSGQLVYERTYSRTKPNGEKETWPETVERVVDGNLSLAPAKFQLENERQDLIDMITNFKIMPAGRHLWASGVKGRQYLFNCHVSGWDAEDITKHFEFSFLRLMEGGGVGANYSNKYLTQYEKPRHVLEVHIVCDPEHPDYQAMKDAGLLSEQYDAEWAGAFAVEDSREGWADALTDLLSTYYRDVKHAERVFDVTRVREAGARLKTFGGRASGPAPLAKMLIDVSKVVNKATQRDTVIMGLDAMEIDHHIAECVVSGGNRRSARMSIMHWDDPQIEQFINCKEMTGKHWTTNISVEVDTEFWDSLYHDAIEGHASTILMRVANGMITNGEPGIWDSSKSNVGEPNEIIATNPCGEIALEAWENCNLGHVNLAGCMTEHGYVDYDELVRAHELVTRFLMRATYGDVKDEKQAAVLARNRRIGVGHFGFASFIAMMGIKYSHAGLGNAYLSGLLNNLSDVVDEAAIKYAHDLRIPIPVKTRTVAPTGTIAKLPGVSEGIHPIFAKYFIRRIRFSTVDPEQRDKCLELMSQGYKVEDDIYADNTVVVSIPTKDTLMESVSALFSEEHAEQIVESAGDLTLEEMLSVQALYQTHWADNAVSYTANVSPEKYTAGDVFDAIMRFGPQLKGTTIFPEMSMPMAPYERLTKEQFDAYESNEIADSVDEECASGACPIK